MRFEKCYKCGKIKLASFNVHFDTSLKSEDIEMVQVGWGRRRGQFRCKICKKPSKFTKRGPVNNYM